MRSCAVIPTYNNSGTVAKVIESVLEYVGSGLEELIVVSDGAGEETLKAIEPYTDRVTLLKYEPNRGKGYALKTAFKYARKKGYDYAVTLDSDGQHFAEDIPAFLEAIGKGNGELFIGSRCLQADNMPSKNTFANKFSNFWFTVQTLRRLPDTQTGYRAYPLARTALPFTSRYEAELEMLVRSAWHGVKTVPVPVKVYYAPAGERVTHFRPGKDFTRISVLNTFMTLAAVVYGWPSMLVHKIIGR